MSSETTRAPLGNINGTKSRLPMRKASVKTTAPTSKAASNAKSIASKRKADSQPSTTVKRPAASKTSTSTSSRAGTTTSRGASGRTTAGTRPTTSNTTKKSSAATVKGTKRQAWDYKGRLEDMENITKSLKEEADANKGRSSALEDAIKSHQDRIDQLETQRNDLQNQVQSKESEVSQTAAKVAELEATLASQKTMHAAELQAAKADMEAKLTILTAERDTLNNQKEQLESDLRVSKVRLSTLMSLANNMKATKPTMRKFPWLRAVGSALRFVCPPLYDLAELPARCEELQIQLDKMASESLVLDTQLRTTKVQLEQTQQTVQQRDSEIEKLKDQIRQQLVTIAEAEERAREDETVRRKLHNTIQELKGNIRVFCRVRPLLSQEQQDASCDGASPRHFDFPDKMRDQQQITVATNDDANFRGELTTKNYEFNFDRVFGPTSTQEDVFEEISQLVQSALDGYNICIFAYGQTGSGKTHTMEGGQGDLRGMIPRAVEQIFRTSSKLTEKGWSYSFSASYLEIYNETIRDLLRSPAEDEAFKHEIKRTKAGETRQVHVTDLTIRQVESDDQVHELLRSAAQNRAVAKTEMNERSSRSHSVFQLHIEGTNALSGDSCKATLNLIDLAGSERLAQSKSTGERLKETQAINKSLSNLGNVIMALGNKESHIPYRNSKLTYLLQDSLGGNSKSLMLINISPRPDSVSESINSLRFATKVNQCQIGTARKVTK